MDDLTEKMFGECKVVEWNIKNVSRKMAKKRYLASPTFQFAGSIFSIVLCVNRGRISMQLSKIHSFKGERNFMFTLGIKGGNHPAIRFVENKLEFYNGSKWVCREILISPNLIKWEIACFFCVLLPNSSMENTNCQNPKPSTERPKEVSTSTVKWNGLSQQLLMGESVNCNRDSSKCQENWVTLWRKSAPLKSCSEKTSASELKIFNTSSQEVIGSYLNELNHHQKAMESLKKIAKKPKEESGRGWLRSEAKHQTTTLVKIRGNSRGNIQSRSLNIWTNECNSEDEDCYESDWDEFDENYLDEN